MKTIWNLFIFLAGALLISGCASGAPRHMEQAGSVGETYRLISDFNLPSEISKFDSLGDGRLICISGDTLFTETGVGTRKFKNLGQIAGLTPSDYGAGFIRVSPDGNRVAIGDGKARIGIFNLGERSGPWTAMPHFDAAWADTDHLAVTQGKFGEPGRVSIMDTRSPGMTPIRLMDNIGGAPGGIAFDRAGNLYTGNGFRSTGPSDTGTVKYFPRQLWKKALNTRVPMNFETQGQMIIDILSAASLGFDGQDRLYVGGSDAFGKGIDINFAALVTHQAVKTSIHTGIPVDPDTRAVGRLDPDNDNAASRYTLEFNPVTQELYLCSGARVYVYRHASPDPGWNRGHQKALEPKQPLEAPAPSPKEDGIIRIMSYNVGGNFIANSRLDKVFNRILSHISPDILIFQEFNSAMANKLPTRLSAILGGQWYTHAGMKSGIYQTMVASRYPFSMTDTDTIPSSGIRGVAAALADLPDAFFKLDLYIMGLHLQCCESHEFRADRQRAADAVMAWIRDARTPGGHIDLPDTSPVILAGDFNFTGDAGPNLTFTTGNISNNRLFGADLDANTDGSILSDLVPKDRVTGRIATWPATTGTPYLRYDRFYYTPALQPRTTGFVLNSLNMTGAQGPLEKNDTAVASDHLPVVMEISAH